MPRTAGRRAGQGGRMASVGRNALRRFVRGNRGGPGRPRGFAQPAARGVPERPICGLAGVRAGRDRRGARAEPHGVSARRRGSGPPQVGITSMREDAGAMTDEELARALLHANGTLAPVILSPDVGRCRITGDRAIPIAGVSAGSSRVSRGARTWRESVEPKRRCRLHPTEGVVQQCRAASRLGTSSR
jgi:hypothetical protein